MQMTMKEATLSLLQCRRQWRSQSTEMRLAAALEAFPEVAGEEVRPQGLHFCHTMPSNVRGSLQGARVRLGSLAGVLPGADRRRM